MPKIHEALKGRKGIVIVSYMEEGDVMAIYEVAVQLRKQGRSPDEIAAECSVVVSELGYDVISVTLVPSDPDHSGSHALHIETVEDDD